MKKGQLLLGGCGCLLCLIATYPSSLHAQTREVKATGNLTFTSHYTGGGGPQYGFQPRPFDYTSNSRLDLTYGKGRLAAILSKPTTFSMPGQPDRYYTLELALPSLTLRFGDLTPRFTDNTTGFARVAGAESKFAVKKVVELHTVYGATRVAAPTQGYMIGTYSQSFFGQRISVTPAKPITVGVSAVKMKDDPTSVDFSAAPYRPRAVDNLVAGSDLTFFFLKRRGSLHLEYAMSVYSDDLEAPDDSSLIRHDTGTLRWLSQRTVADGLVTLNDSTKSGEAVSAKLILPVSTTRTTVEYRRVSRSFRTLSAPYALADNDRYRLQHTSTLFEKALRLNFNGEYQQGNRSGTQAFTLEHLNLFGNVAADKTPIGRVTAGYRQNRRFNDAPEPEPRRADRRLNTVMRSPSLSVTRLVEAGDVALNLSSTLSATWYSDRIRPVSEYRSHSIQFGGQTLPSSRLLLDAQFRYSETIRRARDVERHAIEVQIKNGYDLLREKLHVYAIEGLSTNRSTDGQERSSVWTYGAGVRWSPSLTSTISMQWLSRKQIDYVYADYSFDQHNVELSLTHRW